MIRDRHYRLVAVRGRRVVVQTYVPRGRPIVAALLDAADRFGLSIGGRYRVEQMVREDGQVRWVRGPVFLIS